MSSLEIQIWDRETGHLEQTLANDHVYQDVAWNPYDQFVASGSDNYLDISDTTPQTFIYEANIDGMVQAVAYRPSGEQLVYVVNNNVFILDVSP
jgi:WD40 repeat protein